MKKVNIFVTILILLFIKTCTLASEEIILNAKATTPNLRLVNVRPYSVNSEDKNHPIINKLMSSPLRFIILPFKNGFGFIFQIRF